MILQKLIECERGLTEFNSRTEPAFLNLGKELESLYSGAQLLADLAKRATEVESEKSLAGLISELKSLSEESMDILGSTISGSKDMISQIAEIGIRFKHISCRHRSLEKLSFVTKMLGISSRIQATRLGKIGEEFQFVSKQVSNFSRTLYSYAAELKAEVDQARHKITGIENSIMTRLDDQKQRYDLTSGEMRFTIDILASISEKAAEISSEIKIFSSNVSKEIGEIISAVQFQDITRQQMEHIYESLSETKNLPCFSDNAASNDFRPVYASLLVQISQLNDIRNKISKAGMSISGALSEIDALIVKHTQDLDSFARTEKGTGQGSFTALDCQLDELGKQLHSSFTLGEELFTATKGVSGLVDRVGNNRDRIGKVCTEMKILSINALAQAAPLGTEGARLSVISGDLKELADSWSSRAGELVSGIQEVVLLAKDLEADLFKLLKETQDEAKRSQISCSESLKTLRKAHTKIVSSLLETAHLSSSLKQQIKSILKDLFFQNEDRELGNLITRLEQVKDLIAEKFSLSEMQLSVQEGAEDSLDRYTMECERLNHLRALQKDGTEEMEADLGPNIELF